MTTIIDHAINIPAPTQIVWALISNPEQFPRWQSDCQRVAFLTTQRRGKNTRLRCMGDSGKEYVMEISAWYEGLGYEYKIVDGGPYETNQGRLRLQEIAEGTVVQWTFSYSMAGVLGSLRNMGVRRSAENQVIDSLRNLYRFVRDSAGESNIKVVKSLMQDAPDVDQRATYTPRHPTQYDEEKLRQTGTAARPVPVQRTVVRPIIDEPLPADDDTQRNRPVTPAASAAPVEVPPKRATGTQPPVAPNFTRPINAPDPRPPTAPVRPVESRPPTAPSQPVADPRQTAETRYSTTIPPVPQTAQPAPIYKPDVRPAAFAPTEQRPVPPSAEPTPRPSLPAADGPKMPTPAVPAARVDVNPMTTPPPIGMTPATPPVPSTALPPTIMARPSTTSLPPVQAPSAPEKAPVSTDTGRMSVFELFGLPKPSETQQMKAVDLSLPPEVAAATSPRVEPVLSAPPVSEAPAAPVVEAKATDDVKARVAFQQGMPQTGDLTPEPDVRQGWRALHRRQMLSLRRPTKPQ